jgi:hypothetical protein
VNIWGALITAATIGLVFVGSGVIAATVLMRQVSSDNKHEDD